MYHRQNNKALNRLQLQNSKRAQLLLSNKIIPGLNVKQRQVKDLILRCLSYKPNDRPGITDIFNELNTI